MRILVGRGPWFALLVTAIVGEPVRGDGPEDSDARIAALVKQIGDEEFARREAASAGLEAIGEKALPAVRAALAKADDVDYRRRAQAIVRAIIQGARKSKTTGLEMALVEEGEFQMGSPKSELSRRPDETQHKVRITRAFLIGVHEVTQDEYHRVRKVNPSWFSATGGGKDKVSGRETGRFPVEKVTWYDAVEFCNQLGKLDGYSPYYKVADVKREGDSIKSATVTILGGNGYRLPTEAEWEFACRAYSTRRFHFGNENTGKEANLRPGSSIGYGSPPTWTPLGRTTKVGSYAPNPWGLCDMHGNAGEWCWDWYDRDYYSNSPVDDPQGPATGTQRVVRSGSWMVGETSCRSASRLGLAPDESKEWAGFRVCRTP
jgi:sulfatase modifying factor 1